MELIERDALKDITVMESPIFGFLMKFENGRADIDETTNAILSSVEEDIQEEIRKAPTVDAIPVEWLKKKYPLHGVAGTEMYFRNAYAVKEIMDEWEKECSDRK